MKVLVCYRKIFAVIILCLEVFCLEAAIIERPHEKYEIEQNEVIKKEKVLITSSVVPKAVTTATSTTTITLTEIIKNEPSLENKFTVQSSLHPSVPLSKSEKASTLDSHIQLSESNTSRIITAINNSSTNSSYINEKSGNSMSISLPSVNDKPINSSIVNVTSGSISAVSAILVTSVFQPVIHLERKIELEFFKYLSNLKNSFLQRLAKKVLKNPVSSEALKNIPRVSDEYLSNKQSRAIFKLAKYAEPSMLRCRHPESTITVKCISNVARITFVSDSETKFNAKASINHIRDSITLDGYKFNAYLVWWTEHNKTKSELCYKLTKKMLERKCEECNHMETMIKLEGENHACLIPVHCKQPRNEIITFDTSKFPSKYYVRNIPVVTTSMALHDLENKDSNLRVEEISSGNDIHILIQATSDTINVGISVRECKITSHSMQAVKILVDGCSISNFLENFRVLVSSNDKNYFATVAKFTSFTMKNSSQNLTLVCSLLVCDGICDVHSSCQNNIKQHAYAVNSRIIQKVSLEITYRVLSESSTTKGSVAKSKVEQPIQNNPYKGITTACLESDTNTVSRKVCYIYLVLICVMFIVLLSVMLVYFKRHREENWKRSNYEEEIESSPRTFYYPYDSNPRRRSPNSSSILNLCD